MRNTASRLGLIISVIGCAAMGGSAERLYPANETRAPGDEPYVQVTSVRIEPSTIHKDMKPDRATIIVQIMLRGEAPPDSTARVDVGTYSADPPENKVSYGEQTQTVPLKEKLVAVQFTVELTAQSIRGKVIVAATIHETTKGVHIKQPESYKDWQTELATTVP